MPLPPMSIPIARTGWARRGEAARRDRKAVALDLAAARDPAAARAPEAARCVAAPFRADPVRGSGAGRSVIVVLLR
jgi:hypothetical protein